MFYVYVLESLHNERIYVGFTADLKRRLSEHKQGKTWTTRRLQPFQLIFYEAFLEREDAQRRERYLKSQKGKSTLRMMLKGSWKHLANNSTTD